MPKTTDLVHGMLDLRSSKQSRRAEARVAIAKRIQQISKEALQVQRARSIRRSTGSNDKAGSSPIGGLMRPAAKPSSTR
jgi:hypothetical protein